MGRAKKKTPNQKTKQTNKKHNKKKQKKTPKNNKKQKNKPTKTHPTKKKKPPLSSLQSRVRCPFLTASDMLYPPPLKSGLSKPLKRQLLVLVEKLSGKAPPFCAKALREKSTFFMNHCLVFCLFLFATQKTTLFREAKVL